MTTTATLTAARTAMMRLLMVSCLLLPRLAAADPAPAAPDGNADNPVASSHPAPAAAGGDATPAAATASATVPVAESMPAAAAEKPVTALPPPKSNTPSASSSVPALPLAVPAAPDKLPLPAGKPTVKAAPASTPARIQPVPAETAAAPVPATDNGAVNAVNAVNKNSPVSNAAGTAESAAALAAMTPATAWSIISKVEVPGEDSGGSNNYLLSASAVRQFSLDTRRRIQQALLQIYSEDPAYMQAYRESTMPLSDNLIGPITLSWLNRFWFTFKMDPSGNLTNTSVAALLHFADTIMAHPEWKADLISANLSRWIDGFEVADRARYYQIRLAGSEDEVVAMLRLFHYEMDGNEPAGTDPDRALLSVVNYSLSAADLALLASKAQVLDKLAALQDVLYLNRPLFDAAVLDALKELGAQAKSYLPAARQAALTTSYRLTDDSLQRLRDGKVVPDNVIDALAALNAAYPDQMAFSEAVLDATAKVDAPIDSYMDDIVKAADTSTSYVLSARALEELRLNRSSNPVPPIVLEMIKGLQDVQYPQRWLFDKAVMAHLRYGVGACKSNAPGNIVNKRALTADQMKELKAALNDARLYAQLEKLWLAPACSPTDALTMPQVIEAFYAKYRASIRATARKIPVYDSSKHVLWDGNGCGCVMDKLSGEVVGFYPFWLAGSKQFVDFSTLSRVAYYGASFDDSGILRQANDGRDFIEAASRGDLSQQEFVNVARHHQTAIDWVIQRNDWRSWSKMDGNKKNSVLEQLDRSIVKLLSIRLGSPVLGRMPFGSRFQSTNGSGVTLFFDGYPDDETSVALFRNFVANLRTHLREAKVGDEINILVRHNAMGQGIYSYINLLALINDSDNNRHKDFLEAIERHGESRPHIEVLLDEPTTDSKKLLRERVEQSLHGEERATVLRQIVPVISFDYNNWPQLQDDIIYFKDNFGGVGFWPLALSQTTPAPATVPNAASLPQAILGQRGVQECDISMDVNQCLSDYYQTVPGAQVSAVCKTVCENLEAFRLADKIVLLLLIGCAAAYYLSCRWRELMTRYYHAPTAVTGAAWAFLSLALLFCDPFLHYVTSGYMIPIFLVLFIVALVVWYQYRLKEKDDQP